MNRSTIQWFLTLAGLSGIASIFLKFAHNVSPFAALDYHFGIFCYSSSEDELWVLGAPFLLSVIIFAFIIRWCLSVKLSLIEQIVGYLIGLSIIVIVIWTNFAVTSDLGFAHEVMMAVIFSISFLIAGIVLVIRNLRVGKFKNFSPIMLMQTAYLGNAILCLIGFWGNWQIGAYLTLATVIVYAAQMIWISCQKKEIIAKEQI